jgi:simple sugar transport system permease protein
VPLAVLAGILAGAFWGFIPGLLKAWSGAHEVVTTIMLNYIAISLLAALVSGPLKVSPLSPQPVTADVGGARLPIILGESGHLGILFALVAVVFIAWLLYRTTRGFEIRTVGANPDAGRYAGMRPRFLVVFTMSVAGGLAGLAGTIQLLGVSHNMSASYGTTVGFDSIAVALLGRSSPFGIVFAALLFGAMRAGSALMQQSVPRELVDVVQAMILLFLVAAPVLLRLFRLRGAKADVGTPDTISRTYGSEAAVQ